VTLRRLASIGARVGLGLGACALVLGLDGYQIARERWRVLRGKASWASS
jgi:hypothetical protein